MEKEATFRVWATDEGPPTHSVPAHLIAKAAAEMGEAAFEKIHDRLLSAYFTDNRDISDLNVLKELWDEIGLPSEGFENHNNPELLGAVAAEHNESLKHGVTGVPAVMIEGLPGALVGAQEEAVYRRIVQSRLRETEPDSTTHR